MNGRLENKYNVTCGMAISWFDCDYVHNKTVVVMSQLSLVIGADPSDQPKASALLNLDSHRHISNSIPTT